MPDNRVLTSCLAISILVHLLAAAVLTVFPIGPRRAPDVAVVSLVDMPRATEFLPPRPGIVEGARPAPPPRQAPPERREKPPAPSTVPAGRVPDLPVSPDLPPEKVYPAARPRPEPPAPAESEAAPEKPAARNVPPAPPRPEAKPGRLPSARDLTPSFKQAFTALAESGGRRSQEQSSGSAIGTGGKASPAGEITEEHRGGTHLTALNAPEIQYISYFASIKRKIELVWQYPYDAAQQGIQGELVIEFVIGRSGALESVNLVQGSGHKILDDEALRALKIAAPFNPIPDQYKIPNLSIRGHFVYEMHQLRMK